MYCKDQTFNSFEKVTTGPTNETACRTWCESVGSAHGSERFFCSFKNYGGAIDSPGRPGSCRFCTPTEGEDDLGLGGQNPDRLTVTDGDPSVAEWKPADPMWCTYACQILAATIPADASVVYELYQSDFDSGTVIIEEPGIYRLMEDITFLESSNPPARPVDVATYLMPYSELQ
jgi:hypothetical protein